MRCDEAFQESERSVEEEALWKSRRSVEMKHHGRAGGASRERRNFTGRKKLEENR